MPSLPGAERTRGDINQGPFASRGVAQDAPDIGKGRAAASREASIDQVGRFFAFPARRLGKEKINHGDSYVLASDGLWSELDLLDIRDALLDDDIEKSLEQMVATVLKSGAPDNLTAILFRVN